MKKKQLIYRWLIYLVGMTLLALGIVLNSKSDLGMAPVLSIMFCLSQIFDLNFSEMTLWYYIFLVALQFVIRWRGARWTDLLQVPLSVVFTRFMRIFSSLITFVPQTIWEKLGICALAVIATGIGVTLAVNMRLVPNPGEGMVQTISDKSGLSLGTAKNLFDGGSAVIAVIISLLISGRMIGVGIGTVINIIGTGRVVALTSHLVKDKICILAFGSAEGKK